MTDRELADSFLRTRSENGFRLLYRAKTPALYRTALRLTANRKEEAEELIQEMWVIAIRKLPQFEWRSELKTWLVGILINLCKKLNAGKQTESLEEIDLQAFIPTASHHALDLENAIAFLPQGYRQVVVLHDVEGFKHAEIAEMLQISEGTSKSQLFHAREPSGIFIKMNDQWTMKN